MRDSIERRNGVGGRPVPQPTYGAAHRTPRRSLCRALHCCGPLLSLLCLFTSGCQSDGIGDPCVPEDEYRTQFGGYSKKEVNVESRSFQCESRLCLVNKFQGRVSCPYGQMDVAGGCRTPDGTIAIAVPVEPQLQTRPVGDAVYCSCRCAGDDPDAPYCECPNGFSCTDLVPYIASSDAQLAGSYCVKNGTEREPSDILDVPCDAATSSCGAP